MTFMKQGKPTGKILEIGHFDPNAVPAPGTKEASQADPMSHVVWTKPGEQKNGDGTDKRK